MSRSTNLVLALCLCLARLPAAPASLDNFAPFLLDLQSPATADLAKTGTRESLAAKIVTIVDKPSPSPTGDAHDYVSYARYWWPDPSKPDGRPFLRNDGKVNRAQTEQGDEKRFFHMTETIEALAVAWKLEGRADCARRAGEWLRAWFVTPATRMNPQLEYAQVQLGHHGNHGNGTGILDTRGFVRIVDSLRLLHGSPALSADDEQAVRQWLESFYQWLRTSANGQAEHAAKNNHGSWYLVQTTALARYLGHDDDARALGEEDKARIAWQLADDGSQPLEIAREDGLSYSAFNLNAQLQLALLVRPLGISLEKFQGAHGVGLRQALDNLHPFIVAPEKWPHKQGKHIRPGSLNSVLVAAARIWPDITAPAAEQELDPTQ